jgi:hypothetical protein
VGGRGYEDYEDEERRPRRRKGAPGIALAACIMLLISVVVIVIGGVEGIYGAIVASPDRDAGLYVGAIFGFLLRLLFAGLLVWGAVEFRRFAMHGGAITATVFAFIEAFLFFVYAALAGVIMSVDRTNLTMELQNIIMLEIGYSVFGCIVHGITGLVCVVALNNSQVKKAFRRGRSSRYE